MRVEDSGDNGNGRENGNGRKNGNGHKSELAGRGGSIEVIGVAFSYGNGRVLNGLSLRIEAGEMVALAGPNGSGKTTLLRVLSGTLHPQRGEVKLDGEPVARLSRLAIAKRMAVLSQDTSAPFAFTARQIVLMGRIPYLHPLIGETRKDHEVARQAMAATATDHLADRVFNELSGGERQRVLIAMALAQQPTVLLLDEPTVHLDINHQIEVLELVRRLNRETGITVVSVMHDLNLAALYFERIVMVSGGRVVANGRPADVLVPEVVQAVFNTAVRVVPHPTGTAPCIIVMPRSTT